MRSKEWLLKAVARLWPVATGSISLRPSLLHTRALLACESGERHPACVLYGRRRGKRLAQDVPDELAGRVDKPKKHGPPFSWPRTTSPSWPTQSRRQAAGGGNVALLIALAASSIPRREWWVPDDVAFFEENLIERTVATLNVRGILFGSHHTRP